MEFDDESEDYVEVEQIGDEDNTFLNISERDSYDAYLSICYQENMIGLAFYRCGSFVFELLHETYEYGDFSVLKSAIQKLQPSMVIVSSKIKRNLFDFLKRHSTNCKTAATEQANADETNTQDEIHRFQFIAVSQAEFDYERSRNKIISIPIEEPDMEEYQQRYIFLSSFLDFQQQTTIKAFGAILCTLEKDIPIEEFSQIHSDRNELCFTFLNLEYVEMNKNSFEALEIFQEELHPSLSKNGFYKKEGVSLFGLFNVCQTKLGSYQLKKIFQQPISDIEKLNERQSIIQFFLELNDDVLTNLLDSLKPLRDISNANRNFRSSIYRFGDFQLYHRNLESLTQLRKIIFKLSSSFKTRFRFECKFFNEFFYSISDEFILEMINLIKSLINFESSARSNNIQLMDGIDDDLDSLKQKFNSLPDLLREKMIEDRENNHVTNVYFTQMTYIYIPQMGFFVRMSTEVSQSITNLRSYGYEVMFCANSYTFFKNERMREFDKEFGDLNSKIMDRTNDVLHWLAETLYEESYALRKSLFVAGEIDAALAMAQSAKDFQLTRPNLTVSGSLKISQGRHLIHETINAYHVTNDYYSDDQTKINILYGANGSGKSVYVKQNALIVYMAHIGSFVPALSAEIPLIEQIFTRIKTLESISTQLSAFKADLNQIILATKFARKRSFVVLDTFGKGTLSNDALSLMVACINYWSSDHQTPHLLISSQFDLTQCTSMFKKLDKIRFLKFYFRDKQSTFRTRLVENESVFDEDEQSLSQNGIPGTLTERQADISNNIDSFNLEKRFPELNMKYHKFLALSEHCIAADSEESANNVAQLLQATFRINPRHEDSCYDPSE